VERRQRGVDMDIQGRFGARLAVTQPGELYAVAAQTFALDTRPPQLHPLAAIQGQIRGGQHEVARLGGGLPVDHDPEAQLAFARDVPDDGRL
jgi:hypothetical protein